LWFVARHTQCRRHTPITPRWSLYKKT
jgi:hypothetical protein